MKKRGSLCAVPVLLVALVSALPSAYLFCNNAYELRLTDVLLPMAVSVAIGVLGFFVLWLFSRDPSFSALLASAGMVLFLNFNVIVAVVDAIAPDVRVRVYYFAAILPAALIVFGMLRLKRNQALCSTLVRLLLATCSVVFVFNAVLAAPSIVRRRSLTAFSASDDANEKEKLPNLYYLVSDEYASFEEIKKYYGYDNAAFHDTLTELGFSVSDTSYNRAGSTMRNMADNVNLGPVVTDDMTTADCVELRDNGTLYGILEDMGYRLSQLGSFYPLPKLLEHDKFAFDSSTLTMNGETATEVLVKRSMLMPLPTMLYWRTINAEGDMSVFNWLDDPSNYTSDGNRAIFLYICSPHPPFYYDVDGNAVDPENWTNWEDTRYYLEQYQYITKRLERTVRSIVENDPTAIILLQSDHGLRYHNDSDKPHTFLIEDADQRRILNALYMGGRQVDIEGLSGYNTWRRLLTELGGDFPQIAE